MVSFRKWVTLQGAELSPVLYYNGYVYVSANRAGYSDCYGRVLKIDTRTGNVTEVGRISGMAMWEGAYDYVNNRLILVGQAHDSNRRYKSAVAVVNLYNDTVSYAIHPSTDDVNEFVGVVIDYYNNRLIVGERMCCGQPGTTNWPNGGGLWVIPLDNPLDYTKWSRVYEDPNGGEWRFLVMFRGQVWASIQRIGVKSVLARASPTNLTQWTVVDQSANTSRVVGLDATDDMIAYAITDSNNNVVLKYSRDGVNWTSVTVGPSYQGYGHNDVKIIGRYILVALGEVYTGSRLYIVDTTNNSVYKIWEGTGFAFNNNLGVFDGFKRWYVGFAYPFTMYQDACTDDRYSDLYVLEFDVGRKLVVNVSPQSATAGSQVNVSITLLTENNTPIANANVDLYWVTATHNCGWTGTKIASVTTDASGRASTTINLPGSPGRYMLKAVYSG